MKLLGLVLIFFSGSVFASNQGYDLKFDLSINGQHVSSPQVIVRAGETASIVQKTDTEESFLEVVASEGKVGKKSGILMNIVVGRINKDGSKEVFAQPQILTNESETSTITVSDDKAKTTVHLEVVAKRKTL